MSGYVPNPPKGYRNTGVEPVDVNAQHWAQYKDLPATPDVKPEPLGCVFAKSCNLPDGEINHTNQAGFVPVEKLADYGLWAVLATGAAITAEGTSLQLVGGSTAGSAIAQRLGGSLALGLLESAGALAAGAAVGTIALLMPNTNLAPDSAFYKTDQYATLETGRTRVRVNVKTLPDGSVSAYGFYTGGKKDWENVPVIKAEKDGEKYVADVGNGIGLTWTPAANSDGVLGIPALEGVPQLPPVWVYPPTEKSDTLLANPAHPPEFQDAIIWFPDDAGLEPIYIVLSTQLEKNKAAGAAFEEEAYSGFSEEMEESGQQVTIKTESGTRTRLDMIGRDANGDIACVECKASETAPLTRNQKRAFPEIEQSGGRIMGKGKPGFPGGTQIPPTRVEILRPPQK
ncbi:S-type pyocin domain-containing protein [Pseudomonas sp. 43A]|uniref:S-type pyocin domain-containing protein n=1 Tax=unclassified Pseudomonas TaxID=196821 RepID=UPI00158733A1|nr:MULTISPECIES: S-type pyocin domain-containing protein [unclassified Pseudomonas]QKV64286.1 S-type pyocin domain-containing protein [Pseudomonas sp. 43A]QMW07571.1 S-type pyocin domain-containing protein [Pseudomonas sp. 29A]